MDKIVNNSNEPKNDILNLLLLLWGKRKLIIRNCIYAFIAAVVISFSIPKEYTSIQLSRRNYLLDCLAYQEI